MGHTFYQHDVHVVFHTARHAVRESDLARLHAYIATLSAGYGVQQVVVGGMDDHIHLLGNFPLDKAPAAIVRGIKANSSRWLRGINSRYADFAWQRGYGFFSVSASLRWLVVRYIQNQAQHHAKENAACEFEKMKRLHDTAANTTELAEAYGI